MPSIAYLGPPGTYAEAAALLYLKLCYSNPDDRFDNSQLCPYPTIAQAMRAAATGEVDVAVAPVENSIQGGVTMTLDGIWQWDKLQIQQALELPINHALIALASEVNQVKVVYSHPQALAQCQQWLERFLPQVQIIPTDSTTEGLKFVANDSTVAAIASQRAAELHDLPILASPINDYPDNCTRFWVLGLTPPTTRGTHTSLAFSTKQNIPGALVRPLSVFADRNINMSRIESRPAKKTLGDYIFFIDIEAAVEEERVQSALHELLEFTETLKVFGSYAIAGTDN
ncbi:prephenate dehydratase [Pseudanabaena sp. PCC 6802]|uniref:prephenate dehydratase n=1 Tax=Pseudanabaena sp. PCC 6802 TaxID=118173 RepID=UPI0003481D71|nr:prephenate dehydratase [Pseudanabaena sp. PCC 6802]